MNNLIQSGKILYWGTSNWNAEQITAATKICKDTGLRAPIAHQPCYNLMCRKEVDESLTPVAAEQGIGFTTYSPLNSGYLTGKYLDAAALEGSRFTLPRFQETKSELLASDRTPAYVNLIHQLAKISKELDCKPAQLAIAWCLKNPQVSSVILGASASQQMADNLEAVNVFEKLSPEHMASLSKAAVEMPA